MINTALSSPGPNSRFLCRSTMEHVYGILLDEKYLYRSVHAAFVNTKWYEAWLERTSCWTRSSSTYGAQVCSRGRQASLVTAITQDTLVKTQSLFCVCVLVLSSITSRSVAAAAASSLMRFSPSPSCRGDAANPWLESAFITHFGCVSRHLFVSQSIAIACVSCRVSSLLVFPSEYRHCLCFRVLLRQAQHAHAVFTRMSDHGPPNPQFLSTSITKIDGSCSSSSDWRCARAGRAFVTSVNTHPRGLPLRCFLSHHGTKTTWAMAFPRINCRTTTATVLTATATVTLSLRACLFLCYTPITSPSAAESFCFLELLGMG